MNKIAIYIFLILIYLGLAKSFSPGRQGVTYIPNELIFSNIFHRAPVSVILIDYFQAGFLIKTYYQKYKVIYDFKRPQVVIVRTSQDFYEKNKNNLGMSIFRRNEVDYTESTSPMPPGTLYIGDLAYGHWAYKKSGKKYWKFHRAFKHFPKMFYWGDYSPNFATYEKIQIALAENQSFYGINKEFGTDGNIAKVQFSNFFERQKREEFNFKKFLANYIQTRSNWVGQ